MYKEIFHETDGPSDTTSQLPIFAIQSRGGGGGWNIFLNNYFRLSFCELDNCLKDML